MIIATQHKHYLVAKLNNLNYLGSQKIGKFEYLKNMLLSGASSRNWKHLLPKSLVLATK